MALVSQWVQWMPPHCIIQWDIPVSLKKSYFKIPPENVIKFQRPFFQITISPVILEENKEEKGPHLQEPN